VEAPPFGPYGLFPIALFSYTPLAEMGSTFGETANTETGTLAAQLVRPRTARFLAVKLLRAEDRMAECHDDHQQMNIDMEFVGFHGHICTATGEVLSPVVLSGDGAD
jgi:hypothetical protein